MKKFADLIDLNTHVLPDQDVHDVPFDRSWGVGVVEEGLLPGPCDTEDCTARPVVVARIGHGAGFYCEDCWRGDGITRFLVDITRCPTHSTDPRFIGHFLGSEPFWCLTCNAYVEDRANIGDPDSRPSPHGDES